MTICKKNVAMIIAAVDHQGSCRAEGKFAALRGIGGFVLSNDAEAEELSRITRRG